MASFSERFHCADRRHSVRPHRDLRKRGDLMSKLDCGLQSLARRDEAGFDQWVFAIDRRRHVPHGKTDLLNDLLARSNGSALTTLLYLASGIFVICCCCI
jgi:hypothetical protein